MNTSTQTSDHVSIQRLLDILGILDSTDEEEVTYTLISGSDKAAAEKKKDHPRAPGDLSRENKKPN